MGFVRKLTGSSQAESAERAGEIQAQASEAAIREQREAAARAQGFFEPFAGAAERGVEASQFLADPEAQFEFLQQNPLFQLALDRATQQTEARAASRGRLSAGDTLQRLSENVLLSAQPLIGRQREDVLNLLNLGTGIATSQANIETGQGARVGELTTAAGAARAAGEVGAGTAETAGAQNLLKLGIAGASLFGTGGASALAGGGAGTGIGGGGAQNLLKISDRRLKRNRKIIGERNGHNWWSWDWNELAGELFGMFGSSVGVMAQEVMVKNPDAVILENGFYKVNYGEL